MLWIYLITVQLITVQGYLKPCGGPSAANSILSHQQPRLPKPRDDRGVETCRRPKGTTHNPKMSVKTPYVMSICTGSRDTSWNFDEHGR